MARIAGVDLPKGKRIEIALTYIYGIGRSTSQKILSEADINWDLKTDDLVEGQIAGIRKIIDEKLKVEGDLRRDVSMNIKRLMDLGAYRGLRHRKGLPARGHCLAQGMDEGMEVRCVEVVLLVPGGRRQNDVGVDAGRRHPEIERDQKVELSLRRLVVAAAGLVWPNCPNLGRPAEPMAYRRPPGLQVEPAAG